MRTDQKILTMLLDDGAKNMSDIDILNNSGILKNKKPKDIVELIKDMKTLRNAPKKMLMQVREEIGYVRE